MSDKDYIEEAYSDSIKTSFKVLFQAYINAAGDTNKESFAEAAFKKGVVLARRVRDRANAILPP